MEAKRLSDLLQQATEVVKQAGQMFFQQDKREAVHSKGATDFVTDVDTSVQAFLQKKLSELLPEAQFLGEEKDNSDIDFSGLVWINDPVDGTTNLVHNFGCSVVSLALAENEQLILALVYDPYRNELFTAIRGMGAFCNGVRIQVSGATKLSDSLVAVGTAPGRRQNVDQTFAVMRAFYDRCHDIRRLGSAAIDLCYVAAGRTDAYTECFIHPWDYAAGVLIVQEAGGRVVADDGGEMSLRTGSSIACANLELLPKVLEIVKTYGKETKE